MKELNLRIEKFKPDAKQASNRNKSKTTIVHRRFASIDKRDAGANKVKGHSRDYQLVADSIIEASVSSKGITNATLKVEPAQETTT